MKITAIGPLKIEDHDGDLGKLVNAALALEVDRTRFEPVWTVIVERGDGPRVGNESAFFHKLKKLLISAGFDVIKKCPDKDGHMLSALYYLRERKWQWCIQDGNSQIELIHRPFNKGEKVPLMLHNWKEVKV